MRKIVLGVVVLVLLVTSAGFAKDFEVEKKAGDYTLKITMDNNPPIVGDNNVVIEVKDSAGKAVADAKVLVDYGMPAMPGMPAMNYKTEAKHDGGQYKGVLTLSMAGSWNIVVKVSHNHKKVKAKINVDAK
ncbi:MAG: FixH family protein [Nitrospirae bacterium]|uniref:FixH family protein n=1 Tax=Candidatus Magnetobacterium casense TaxID=1455061 RepID=UPI0012DD83C9|nr:FixH family protein [Candidatus Magnetobacterium casensis]MBF0339296.1 FixH family protein [Nitrospirota bacterium]